jgi:cell pole-organizing protein PopZ
MPAPANDDGGPAASLLSAAREAEAAASFASLNHTVFSRNARSIEDVVQDMLRPMLQSWLDAHLPVLVERLVRQEIERISGKS